MPHSDIHGSTPARGSPWLFAACHVLHRLLVPRHPPNALLMLNRPGHPTSDNQALTRHAQEPSTPETPARTTPIPQQASLSTYTSTPLNTAATRPLSTQLLPRGMSQATRPDQAEPDRDGPPPSPPRPDAIAPSQEATEVSCASRDAPEPDSHEQRTGASRRGACDRAPDRLTRRRADALNRGGNQSPRRAAQARRPGTRDPIFP